jgi:nicotinamidase-related amidase
MNEKALLVIDMQNDYLWTKRKPVFTYDTNSLVERINSCIHEYSSNGCDVIYISQVFPDIFTNRLFIGFSIKGTEGAELYDRLDIVSELCFEKNLPDTFTAKAFRKHFESRGYKKVYLCGIDECGCVGATAKGAVKTGASVYLIEKCTGCRYSEKKRSAMHKKLESFGVRYI